MLVAVATAADGEPLLLNGDKLTAGTKTTARSLPVLVAAAGSVAKYSTACYISPRAEDYRPRTLLPTTAGRPQLLYSASNSCLLGCSSTPNFGQSLFTPEWPKSILIFSLEQDPTPRLGISVPNS